MYIAVGILQQKKRIYNPLADTLLVQVEYDTLAHTKKKKRCNYCRKINIESVYSFNTFSKKEKEYDPDSSIVETYTDYETNSVEKKQVIAVHLLMVLCKLYLHLEKYFR